MSLEAGHAGIPATAANIPVTSLNSAPSPNTNSAHDEPVAVLVCHGMGQQVKFSTISAVAECILDEAKSQGATGTGVNVSLSMANDASLVRAEVQWSDQNTGRLHQVHVYEAYWAPVTEGKVSYWDSVGFLLRAARTGLKYSSPVGSKPFRRWMFHKRAELPVGRYSWLFLVVAAFYVLVAIVAIGVGYSVIQRVLISSPSNYGWDAMLTWLSPILPGFKEFLHGDWRAGLKLLGWWSLIAFAVFVRHFLIQYVGDVAAYISPYQDSKFEDIRQKIQKIGVNVGRAVYGLDHPELTPNYRNFVIVGHSLGSVVAYDTLNALINADELCSSENRRGVLDKTKALITFGSPLDKTAFIFRSQARKEEDWIRERLAARMQPLIYDVAYRPSTFTWVNLFSPADIISGSLEYYDDPEWPRGDPRKVQNMRDPQASTPLAAHVQYWGNPMLREQLYKYVR